MNSLRLKLLTLVLAFSSAIVMGQSAPAISEKEANLISSEKVLGAQQDVASIPISINFDNKIGTAHQGSTQYIKATPYLPYRLNNDYSIVLRPNVTFQQFHNFDGYSSSNLQPIVIESFLTESNQKTLKNSFGLGPMVQIATGASAIYGSTQNGAGYSAGAIHRTEDWIIGVTGYQSFGISNKPTVGISANNISLQPFITYITKRYGNFTLESQSLVNIDSGAKSIPITLTGSKIIQIGDTPFLFSLGARYYTVNTMYGGAQGWGGKIGITYAFSN